MIQKLSLEVLSSQFCFQNRCFQNSHGKIPLVGMECVSRFLGLFCFVFSPASAFVFYGTDEYWNSLTEDKPFSLSAYKGCLSLFAIRNWERTILVTARLANLEVSIKFRTLISLEGSIFLHSFRIGMFLLMTIIISILIRLRIKPL